MSKASDLKPKKKLKFKEQYPLKMRREFWKHGLNPITGLPPETNSYLDLRAASNKYIQPGSPLDPAQAP